MAKCTVARKLLIQLLHCFLDELQRGDYAVGGINCSQIEYNRLGFEKSEQDKIIAF